MTGTLFYDIIPFMDQEYFIIEPEEYYRYPDIPDIYFDDIEEQSIILGARLKERDEDTDDQLQGLMICVLSVTDEHTADTTYVWSRKTSLTPELVSDMLPEFIKAVTERNVKKLRFCLVELLENNYAEILNRILKENGFKKLPEHGSCRGYYLLDFYDNQFMTRQVIRACQDQHLLAFPECTEKECIDNLKKLGVTDDETYVAIRNIGSFFYMDKDKPVGAMMIKQYGNSAYIIDGIYINKTPNRGKILKALLAGVLSGSMEGMSMSGRLYIRFETAEDIRVVEECLGEGGIELNIGDFQYVAE